ESGGRRGVGQVVGRDVYGLDGRDRTGLGGGDALLQLAHLFGQGGLVAYGGRHTAQQCRYFGTSQGVTVDVVDEQQYVAAFVTELLGHGQSGQSHAQTVARRLVHLAVHHRYLGVLEVLGIDYLGFLHLVVEVVTFTGTL